MMRLELGIKTGVVKFFDDRDDECFGSIIPEGGGEVFFYFRDGKIAEAGQNGIEWGTPNRNSRTVLNYPEAEDRLFFELKQEGTELIASPWSSEKYYQKAVEDLSCPCGHHVQNHYCGCHCERCKCPCFGEPLENWEEYTEVSLGDGPGGLKAYE